MTTTFEVVVPQSPPGKSVVPALLRHLAALTYSFQREGQEVHCVLVYAVPDLDIASQYRVTVAADTGYEGIACVDDTARAALLALELFERTGSAAALSWARSWLTFITYMQYPDGKFANFIRNSAGIRNASGPTSLKGGYWWSVRALWALARAYRLTGNDDYLAQYRACRLAPLRDGKINAVLALGELELWQAEPDDGLRASILERCRTIAADARASYFRDAPRRAKVHLWGYHQLHAVAEAARVLDAPNLLPACERTVDALLRPDIEDRMWYSFPDRKQDGVCAYCVTPIAQGMSALYRATGNSEYRDLTLQAGEWFYGRNSAGEIMYDPETGRCRDGIAGGKASANCGAESAIEAGVSELQRQALLTNPV